MLRTSSILLSLFLLRTHSFTSKFWFVFLSGWSAATVCFSTSVVERFFIFSVPSKFKFNDEIMWYMFNKLQILTLVSEKQWTTIIFNASNRTASKKMTNCFFLLLLNQKKFYTLFFICLFPSIARGFCKSSGFFHCLYILAIYWLVSKNLIRS